MDSILGTDRKKIEAIKETIRNPKMTADEISSYLSQVIQTEMKKPLAEMDEALVKECEDILWQLNSDTDYVSHASESKIAAPPPCLHRRRTKLKSGFQSRIRLILSLPFASCFPTENQMFSTSFSSKNIL